MTKTKRNKHRLTTATRTATEIIQTGYSKKNSLDQSIDLCVSVLRDACHKLFCVFGNFYVSGTQDAEVTKSLPCNSYNV